MMPVHISWRIRGELHHRDWGTTKDISSRGMFVVSRTIPPKGVTVQFTIHLSLDEFPTEMSVAGVGQVVRVEPNSTRTGTEGFAIANESFQMQEPKNKPRHGKEAVERISKRES
jgi:hypothetical protein